MKLSINKKIFSHIITSSNSFSTNDISFMFNKLDSPRIGFVVPRSMGSAHLRNKFKRRCRASLQSFNQNVSLPPIGIIVKPKTINLDFLRIKNSFNLLEKTILTKYGVS